MWKKTALLWLATGIVLGACGNTAEEATTPESEPVSNAQVAGSEQTETNPQPAENEQQTDTSEQPTPTETDAATPDAAGSNVNSGTTTDSTSEEADADPVTEEPEASATEAEVPIEYHMNANYDIVPNEGSEAPKKVVLLTFDDGPKEAEMINGLFDTLDKHDAKAIFFVNGYRVKENPELLKLIQERGGIVGNHSYDHIYLNQQTDAEIKKQIESAQTIIEDTIGETPEFFRPPNAAGNDYAHQVAKENGLLYMTWSVGSLDWVNQDDPQAVIDNVFDQLHAGSNILMHELPWTVEALDDLLTQLEAKGYGFVDPRSIDTTKQP